MDAPGKAVVLLSGRLDSTTALALARRDGFEACAITFRYGQRHDVEIKAARTIARRSELAHHLVVDINLRRFGHSSLTADIPVQSIG